MKAVTVWNPWAWAIATNLKPVENRTRVTSHRGEIAIHSGKHWDEAEAGDWRIMEAAGSEEPLEPDDPRFVFGAIIAVAELVEVTRGASSPWAEPGQVHWVLANVRPLGEPVPVPGLAERVGGAAGGGGRGTRPVRPVTPVAYGVLVEILWRSGGSWITRRLPLPAPN